MKIKDFIQKAKNTKEVNFVKDNSKRDFIGVWNTDVQIWSKSKRVLEGLGYHCPNEYIIECIDGEYMMDVFSTAKTYSDQ